MAYEWILDESVDTGINRIISELIDFTIERLSDDTADHNDAVHDARKSFKKIRAVLRLVRDEIGDDIYQEHNALYRDLGRELAPLRDAFVVVEIMDGVIKELDDKDLKKIARALRKDLKTEFEKIKKEFWQSGDAVTHVVDTLKDNYDTLNNLPIEHDKFKAFKKGLRRVYQRGQDRMEVAYVNIPSAEGFHDWRKRVKYLWYQMRILEPIHPAHITALVTQLDQLADLLGQAHDLAVVYERLEDHPLTQDGDGRLLLAYLDQKRGELEASARPFGDVIYEMDRKAFVKQVKDWWKNPEPILA